MKNFFNRQTGFTLIEIMLVVAIVALLATIAVPQMLRSRMNANEVTAISALRTVASACQEYYNDVVPHTYPPDLPTLSTAIPSYIDPVLANATARSRAKQGYWFTYTRVDGEHFTIIAWPSYFGRTGARNFFTDETSIITYTTTEDEPPTPTSPAVVYQ